MIALYRQIFDRSFLEKRASMASTLESRRYINLTSGVLAVLGLTMFCECFMNLLSIVSGMSASLLFPIMISSPFMLILMLVYGEGSMAGGKLDKISEKITGYSKKEKALAEFEHSFMTGFFYQDTQEHSHKLVALIEHILNTLPDRPSDPSYLKDIVHSRITGYLNEFKSAYMEHNLDALLKNYVELYRLTQDFAQKELAIESFEEEHQSYLRENAQFLEKECNGHSGEKSSHDYKL